MARILLRLPRLQPHAHDRVNKGSPPKPRPEVPPITLTHPPGPSHTVHAPQHQHARRRLRLRVRRPPTHNHPVRGTAPTTLLGRTAALRAASFRRLVGGAAALPANRRAAAAAAAPAHAPAPAPAPAPAAAAARQRSTARLCVPGARAAARPPRRAVRADVLSGLARSRSRPGRMAFRDPRAAFFAAGVFLCFFSKRFRIGPGKAGSPGVRSARAWPLAGWRAARVRAAKGATRSGTLRAYEVTVWRRARAHMQGPCEEGQAILPLRLRFFGFACAIRSRRYGGTVDELDKKYDQGYFGSVLGSSALSVRTAILATPIVAEITFIFGENICA